MKTADDYRKQLIALLPPGRAFPRIAGNTMDDLLGAIAEELARVDARGDDLLREAFPDTTDELIIDWERVAGLPSDCLADITQTKAQRRQVLVSKLSDVGDNTPQGIIDIAAEAGYVVTVDEFSPFEAGHSAAGESISNDDWVFVLKINGPESTVTEFKVGESAVGEALRSWGNERLECVILEKAHAHWVVLFAYA